MPNQHILPLYDSVGELRCVQISAEFWNRYQHHLKPHLTELAIKLTTPIERIEPLNEWQDFLRCWDFTYPVSTEVLCKNCSTHVNDWQTGNPKKLFSLKSAQLGGLIVFHCHTCGATVRKKHFKDHYCFEATPTTCVS